MTILRRRPRTRLGLLALGVTGALLLASCGSADLGAASPAGSASSEAVPTLTLDLPAEGVSATVDRIRKDGVLRAGVISPGGPPFALQDPVTSAWSGPAPDHVIALADALGVKVQWVEADWDTIIAGLQADKYDIAATALYATAERKEVVDFVDYAKSGACYVARKDDDRVNSLADLGDPDLKVLVVSGSSAVTDFPAKYPDANVTAKPLATGASGFYSEITSGRFDVTTIESVTAKAVAQQQPDLKIIPDADTCIAEPDLSYDVGLAVRKDDPTFRDLLQATATQLAGRTKDQVQELSAPDAGK